ncbi:winged helix-turn-helix domain-containing protein [Achromobacter xylosoxidans]
MQHSYAVLADHIKAAIHTHEYRVGDRLPSVRELAAAQGVSVSTATRCYRLLEHEGYAQARYKSGMYVADWKALRQARAAPETAPPLAPQASSTTCWPRCSTE